MYQFLLSNDDEDIEYVSDKDLDVDEELEERWKN